MTSKTYPSHLYTAVTKRRRGDGYRSSSEESYVGPMTPPNTDFSSFSSPPPAAKRPRRTAGLPNNYPLVDQHNICIEPDRVGFPSVTRQPAYTCPIPTGHRYAQLWTDEISLAVGSILKNGGLIQPQFNLCYRQWRGHLWEGTVTNQESPVVLFVVALLPDQEQSKVWAPTCRELRDLLVAHGWTDVGVEIAVSDIEEEKRSYPIHPDDEFLERWPSLEDQIIDVLRVTGCSRLDVVRRGKAPKPNENPITLAITIPEESTQDWTMVSEKLVAILDENNLFHVVVEIARGVLWQAFLDGPGRFLPLDEWTLLARVGGSLGIRGMAGMSATLGGFIEIQQPGQSWERYGVTCHHAVVPSKVSGILEQLDVDISSKCQRF